MQQYVTAGFKLLILHDMSSQTLHRGKEKTI